jgi:hypothetical protein
MPSGRADSSERPPGQCGVVILTARAAYPYVGRERAAAGLRGELRLMALALAFGATPDWTTLAVEGPVEALGLHGRTWYEWTATVESATVQR